MSTTLAELKAEIRQVIHRSAAHTAGYEDIIIRTGERWLWRHARTRHMETALSVAIASGVAACPADYVELKHAYIDGSPIQTLQRKSSDWILATYPTRSADSKPRYIGRDAGNFIFGPYPDSGYTVKGVYFARPTSIISGVTTFFTDNYDLFLYAALAESGEVLNTPDNRIARWVAKRDRLLLDVNSEAQREKASGGALSMSLG